MRWLFKLTRIFVCGRFLLFEYLSLSVFVYYGVFSITITPNMPVRSQETLLQIPIRCVAETTCIGPLCMPALNSTASRHQLMFRSALQSGADGLRLTVLTNGLMPVQIAYMISGMIYFMWSLHCGFIIPSPSYPGWWIWL